ncbi:MAG: hypothetical protein IPP03_05840 [Dechloromonas sp.]|jgi:hypothetical protein|nr:hypothetical protein [Candidatus Dechloromonas phosphoritropha]
MKTGLLLLLTLVTLSEAAHADAIKCRMPNGKVVITDGACSGGASVEQVRPSEYISPQRQRQAYEVNARTAAQVEGIEAEKAADRAALQKQQRAVAAEDARQASIRLQQEIAENQRRQRDLEIARAAKEARQPELAADYQAPAPLSVIKSCNGASCSDQTGQRYTTEAGKTTRSDGARCYQRGKVMYCD